MRRFISFKLGKENEAEMTVEGKRLKEMGIHEIEEILLEMDREIAFQAAGRREAERALSDERDRAAKEIEALRSEISRPKMRFGFIFWALAWITTFSALAIALIEVHSWIIWAIERGIIN